MAELTQPQVARPSSLLDGHAIVGETQGSPLVERPDGRVVCLQANGRLVATTPVPSVQSYLHLEPC